MWLSDAFDKTGAAMAGAGATTVRYLRAGYPDTLPRQGFIAAVALLHRESASEDADSAES